MWTCKSELKSDKLKRLADSLPNMMLSSKAASTNVKYKNAWLCWKKWEKDNVGVNSFPVSPFLFCLYLRDKFESCQSPSPIEAAVYGVKWAHNMAGIDSPTDHIMVKQLVEASKRLLGKPVKGKQPLELEIIKKVADKLNVPNASFYNLRSCFIFCVGFACLMRCDEMIHVMRKHVCISSDHMTISCPKRRNDQYSKGHVIHFARSGKSTCPVSITEKILARLPKNPDQCLVCRLRSNGVSMPQSIGYSRVREIFHETIAEFVDDPKRYGTHSLKKGGASACHRAGVSGECLDRHAGWKSARSKLSYINYSVDDKLLVSRAINL